MGEYREFGRVGMVEELGNFWLFKELVLVWGEDGRSGKMWGRSEKVCWGGVEK